MIGPFSSIVVRRPLGADLYVGRLRARHDLSDRHRAAGNVLMSDLPVAHLEVLGSGLEHRPRDSQQSLFRDTCGCLHRVAGGIGDAARVARRVEGHGVGVGLGHAHLLGRDAELFGHDLAKRRVLTRANVDRGDRKVGGAVAVQLHDCAGVLVDVGEAHAAAHPERMGAETDTALLRAAVARRWAALRPADPLGAFAQAFFEPVGREREARVERVRLALLAGVSEPELDRVEAELITDLVDL